MNILQTDIKFVPGVGPKRAEILNKEIDAFTLGDLLRWYPYRYIDRTRIYYVHEIDNAQAYIQLKGKITAFESFGEGRRRRLVALLGSTGFVDLVWFQGIRFVRASTSNRYIVFGKPALFNGKWNITPDIVLWPSRIVPRTDGDVQHREDEDHFLNSRTMQKIIHAFSLINERLRVALSRCGGGRVDAVSRCWRTSIFENTALCVM